MDYRFMSGLDNRRDRKMELAAGGNIFEQIEKKKRQDYAAIDARNAMQQDFENKRALQSDLLAGNMDVARENNAGALARQQLQGEFGLKDTGLKGDYALRQEGMRGDYGLQQEGMRGISQVNAAIAGSGGKSGNGNNAAYTEAIKGIWADMGMNPEQKFEATKKAHEMFFGGAQQQAGGEVNPMPDASGRGSAVEPNPKNGTKYFKPDPAPTAAAGAQSMTFQTDIGTASANPGKKKKESFDLYNKYRPYGTGPFGGE
ncbi:MAG: hypothetical protein KBA28_05290 [Syntrophaceae bacterium]|jgi:hypothetical protein|nr:hypothetical protein [Syntrophaceae bacterium]